MINVIIILAIALMLFMSWFDVKTYTLPLIPIIGIGLLGLIYRFLINSEMMMVVGLALVVSLLLFAVTRIMELVFKKVILGYGDIQLLVVSLIWLTIEQVPLFLIITGLVGIIESLIYRNTKYFPFAPAIAIGWLIAFNS